MSKVYVGDYLPDGTSPCLTVWDETPAHWDDREEQAIWRREEYELLHVLVGRSKITPAELVAMGGELADYERNLRDAIADGLTCEEPKELEVAA